MARVAHREGYPEIGLYWEKAAHEEAEHAAKFAAVSYTHLMATAPDPPRGCLSPLWWLGSLQVAVVDQAKKMCIRDRSSGRSTVSA